MFQNIVLLNSKNLVFFMQVLYALMKLGKPDAVFTHCLPAVPGEEMTAEVLRGPQSIVIDQAENRLWTVQTLLATRIFG